PTKSFASSASWRSSGNAANGVGIDISPLGHYARSLYLGPLEQDGHIRPELLPGRAVRRGQLVQLRPIAHSGQGPVGEPIGQCVFDLRCRKATDRKQFSLRLQVLLKPVESLLAQLPFFRVSHFVAILALAGASARCRAGCLVPVVL